MHCIFLWILLKPADDFVSDQFLKTFKLDEDVLLSHRHLDIFWILFSSFIVLSKANTFSKVFVLFYTLNSIFECNKEKICICSNYLTRVSSFWSYYVDFTESARSTKAVQKPKLLCIFCDRQLISTVGILQLDKLLLPMTSKLASDSQLHIGA